MNSVQRKLNQIRIYELKQEITKLSLRMSGKDRQYAQEKTKECIQELHDLEDSLLEEDVNVSKN